MIHALLDTNLVAIGRSQTIDGRMIHALLDTNGINPLGG